MAPKRDLTGKKFGRLTVIRELPERKHHSVLWLCRCECGNEVKVKSSNLNSGRSQSCGCLRVEHSIKAHQTHKKSDTKLFAVWCGMRFRCNNPNDKSYLITGRAAYVFVTNGLIVSLLSIIGLYPMVIMMV